MHKTTWPDSTLGGRTSGASETVAATASALEAAGFRNVGGALGERPYTYCRPCRAYSLFHYYMRKSVIVTCCKECGIVPIDERALTIEGVSL